MSVSASGVCACVLFVLLVHSAASLQYTSGLQQYEHVAELAYDATANAWTVDLRVPSHTYVVPQLEVGGSNHSECSAGMAGAWSCIELMHFLVDPQWLNDNVDDAIAETHLWANNLCAGTPALADLLQASACVLHTGFLCVMIPGGLQLTNTPSELQRFNRNSTSVALRVRLVYITLLQSMNRFSVHSQCVTLAVTAPHTNGAVLSVQNACRARGLTAPELSSMRVMRLVGGSEFCVWECRQDHIRWPWNSDPFHESDANNTDRRCRLIPRQFFAVMFAVRMELLMPSVDPGRLNTAFLRSLNTLADDVEQEMRDTPRVDNVVVAMSVPHSRYDTQDFSSLVHSTVAYYGMELHHEILVVPEFTAGLRRVHHTSDLHVNGMCIFNASHMTSAAVYDAVWHAIDSALSQFQSPAMSGVVNTHLTHLRQMHRVYYPSIPGDTEPAAAAPEIYFSATDYFLLGCALLGVWVCSMLRICPQTVADTKTRVYNL